MVIRGRRGAFLILLAFALIWVPNLGTIPAWYWDEGVNLNYAKNLAGGRALWFDLEYAFVPHPPLYIILTASAVTVFGESIMVLRVLSVALNLAIAVVIYLIGSKLRDHATGLMATALFAVYPAAVYWGRMGFSNHLLSLLTVASLYFFLRYLRDGGRWYVPCCMSAGLAPVTEPQGLLVASALAAYFIVVRYKTAPKALMLLFAPSLAFIAFMAATSDYFIGDVFIQLRRFNLLRPHLLVMLPVVALIAWKRRPIQAFATHLLSSEVEHIFEGKTLFRHFYVPVALLAAHFITSVTIARPLTDEALFTGGDYYWLGIVGLLFMPAAYMNSVVLLYFLPTFFSVLALGRSDHMLIPLYPFFAIGLSFLLTELYSHLKSRVGVYAAIALVAYPFAFAYANGVSAYALGCCLKTTSTAQMQQAVNYVNKNANEGDLVLTVSYMTGFFPNPALVTQSVVYDGYPVGYYIAYPRERFIKNISHANAAYVVVPEGTLNVLKDHAPGPAETMQGWPRVYKSGIYEVYENPATG